MLGIQLYCFRTHAYICMNYKEMRLYLLQLPGYTKSSLLVTDGCEKLSQVNASKRTSNVRHLCDHKSNCKWTRVNVRSKLGFSAINLVAGKWQVMALIGKWTYVHHATVTAIIATKLATFQGHNSRKLTAGKRMPIARWTHSRFATIVPLPIEVIPKYCNNYNSFIL